MERIYLPAAVSAIRAEINTGLTFARIALSSDDPRKTARNTSNARKAYDTARQWLQKTTLTPAESKEIAEQLEQLRQAVANLKG